MRPTAILATANLVLLLPAQPVLAKADLDTAPLHVEWKVESGERHVVIASGAMDMEAQEMTDLELSQPGPEKQKLNLQLYGRIHHDGTIAIWAHYEEESMAGDQTSKILWQPSMQGKRGVPLTASVHSGKVDRLITVVVR